MVVGGRWSVIGGRYSTASGSARVASADMTRSLPLAVLYRPPTTDHQPPTTDHRPPTRLWPRRRSHRRALTSTAIEEQLEFHAPILSAPCRSLVICYSGCLAITHWRNEPAEWNLMINRQVLNHRFSALTAELEVLRVAARRVCISSDLEDVPLGIEGFLCQGVKVLLGLA